MVTRYCTHCWVAQADEVTRCTRCGQPLASAHANGISYLDKLLTALQHPEPDTRTRAAMLLGTVADPGDARAVRALLATLRTDLADRPVGEADLQAAAARALGQLGACTATAPLRHLALDERQGLVAALAAVEALAELAHGGCDQAGGAIERLAREAGRGAIRLEACAALARLNEPR